MIFARLIPVVCHLLFFDLYRPHFCEDVLQEKKNGEGRHAHVHINMNRHWLSQSCRQYDILRLGGIMDCSSFQEVAKITTRAKCACRVIFMDDDRINSFMWLSEEIDSARSVSFLLPEGIARRRQRLRDCQSLSTLIGLLEWQSFIFYPKTNTIYR